MVFYPLGFTQQSSSPESCTGSSSSAITFTTYLFLTCPLSSAGKESRIHATELFLSLRVRNAQSKLPSTDILGVRVLTGFQDDKFQSANSHSSMISIRSIHFIPWNIIPFYRKYSFSLSNEKNISSFFKNSYNMWPIQIQN